MHRGKSVIELVLTRPYLVPCQFHLDQMTLLSFLSISSSGQAPLKYLILASDSGQHGLWTQLLTQICLCAVVVICSGAYLVHKGHQPDPSRGRSF